MVLLLLLKTVGLELRADDFATKGREVLAKYSQSVVSVQVVLKLAYSGNAGNETKQELTGTVIDASGLTVLALSACDPNEVYQRFSEDSSSGRMQTEVTDIKILLEDGTEVPSEIVLRDKDLDLAFIRPKSKPAAAMAAVDLSQSASIAALDQVVTCTSQQRGRARLCRRGRTDLCRDQEATNLLRPGKQPDGDHSWLARVLPRRTPGGHLRRARDQPQRRGSQFSKQHDSDCVAGGGCVKRLQTSPATQRRKVGQFRD